MGAEVTITDRSWLDAPAPRKLIAALDAAGLEFRFVGGAVRDALLDRPVADVDLATPALPEAVIAGLDAAGLKSIPTGVAHGTVTALVDGHHFEITTLRRDVETDGRHATVAFSRDWREDAARRDFTMNALYADRDGRVSDFFGGIEDAYAGRVRFIGDPETRIAEDALRILRFFRFHARYGRGKPDPEGLAACGRLAAKMDRLSGERVRDELLKLLAAPDPAWAWRAMAEAGVAAYVLADAKVDDLERMVRLEALFALQSDSLRRLAGLAGRHDAEGVAALKKRLKLSNRDAERLLFSSGAGPRTVLIAHGAFGRALYAGEPTWVRDAALLEHVRSGSPDLSKLGEFLRFLESWHEPRFPLTGADLRRRGVPEGEAVGRLLREIELWWATSDFTPDRQACLAELDRVLARAMPPRGEAT